MKVQVELSDLQKIEDALSEAYTHHYHRDRMNATLHLAKEVRFSPLTSMLSSELDRVRAIQREASK